MKAFVFVLYTTRVNFLKSTIDSVAKICGKIDQVAGASEMIA